MISESPKEDNKNGQGNIRQKGVDVAFLTRRSTNKNILKIKCND